MRNGKVYWITGLSGSGKTTIGMALYYILREKQDNVLILDGDILKKLVGESVGYTKDERLKRAKQYSQLCKILSDQGMCVIICTIAMFDEIREWNRKNIKGYIEVFLDVSMEVLKIRDKKGLYSGYNAGIINQIVGVDIETQFPKNPDIILNNDGQMSIKDCVKKIEALLPRNIEDFDRDKSYWNKYYHDQNDTILSPSDFAVSLVQKYNFLPGMQLLDLGCGNGRDSRFFLNQGLYVTGVDASDVAIDYLNAITKMDKKAVFVCDDFVKCKTLYQKQYDYIYSRFTLHAITEEQETELLQNVAVALKKDGCFFIEARTTQDDLYGKGEKIKKDTYVYENHFRRFIDFETFQNKMINMGYKIVSAKESRGFSACKTSDPVLLRIIAKI